MYVVYRIIFQPIIKKGTIPLSYGLLEEERIPPFLLFSRLHIPISILPYIHMVAAKGETDRQTYGLTDKRTDERNVILYNWILFEYVFTN